MLASARPGYEFLDWGGAHHVGGGSHGSLHANDSLGGAALVRHRPGRADAREQWALRDIVADGAASTSASAGRST